MIVCLCKVVSDRKIHECVKNGHTTLKAVSRECGAGTDCGACLKTVHGLIRNQSSQNSGSGTSRR